MMRIVEHRTPSTATLAYIAPTGDVLCEPEIHQELLAIENLGWSIVPIAISPPERSPRAEFTYAVGSLTLKMGRPAQRCLRGILAALELGPPGKGSLKLLAGDLQRLGWLRPRGWGMARRWLAAARVARLLQAKGCSHVHAHGADEPAQVAMYAAAMCGITFTCTAYGRELFRHSLLLKEIATRSRSLITSSHFNKQQLEQQGVDPQHIAVVRSAPRTPGQPKAVGERTKDGAPSRRGLRTGPFRIGVLCNLIERAGVDDLLIAVAQLIRDGCAPVRLLIAGQGPERLRLQVQADRLGIHACVEFVGEVAPASASAWLRSLDLYVTASKPDRRGNVDGIPANLVDAMAQGVPVVATRVTGVPELVIEDRTGFLAEPGQPASLAEQIDRAMGDPDRARALAQAGRAHVRWEFGREQNLRRLVSHFGPPAVPAAAAHNLERAA